MKLVTFKNKSGQVRTGWLKGEGVVDMQLADANLPGDMLSFIDEHERYFALIADKGLLNTAVHYSLSEGLYFN